MNFTDSRYEPIMQEPPRPELPVLGPPKGCLCMGCPYWRGIVCVSCYKKLLRNLHPGGGPWNTGN